MALQITSIFPAPAPRHIVSVKEGLKIAGKCPTCRLWIPGATSGKWKIGEGAMLLNMARMSDREDDLGGSDGVGRGTAVITRTRPKTKKPSLYRVLLLTADYTPMEVVVHVLERFFQKNREAATRIMLHVHNHGVGECGVYTFEVAETKVSQVMDFARQHQHPLQCV